MLTVQISQKERHVHENEHDGRHKYNEILNQDNDNQDGMSYSLKTHKEKTGNLIYEHDIDTERGNKDTQKYVRSYNQECCNPILDPPRFSQMLFYFYYYL